MKFTSVLTAIAGVVLLLDTGALHGQGPKCGMQMNQQPVIFCETFDQPSPVMSRAGQLNGALWGVSRQLGRGVEWKDSTLDGCGGSQPASANGATDVIICNGQLRDSVDDDFNVSVLAMYPKQPFDFAGRTGTVSFDVSNDTTGAHGAWPEFWITDQPVPVPSSHLVPCDLCAIPRHSFGIRFAADRGACPGGWRADSIVITRNYVVDDHSIFDTNSTGPKITETGCASLGTGPNGGLNHVEVRVSQDKIDVYASDAGKTSPLHHINSVVNANLSFTRGLIWIEDAHYNAEKAHTQDPSVPDQKNHTYAWDNVAFDGPPTYRDLSFDVLDATKSLGNGVLQTGWPTSTTPVTLMTLPMTAQSIASATNANLMFVFGKDTRPTVFNYTINGHANSAPSPLPASAQGMRTLAVPVPLGQLVAGPQKIEFSTDVQGFISNVNIVLVAALPVPGQVLLVAPSNPRLGAQP